MALSADEENTRGGNAFDVVINKFDRDRLNYAHADLQMLKAIYEDQDAEKAMTILIGTLQGEKRLSLKEFCGLLIDYSPRFETGQVKLLNDALEKYMILPSDHGQECWLYLAQVISYAKSGNLTGAKEAAVKAHGHPAIPQEYKKILEESFGVGE
jgi:hypothetical protein